MYLKSELCNNGGVGVVFGGINGMVFFNMLKNSFSLWMMY